jgi:EAL domain-containing protein (putative c-di-GMP-specific phosphodiesterase class I)
MLTPAQFLSLADETGLITEIDWWVLEQTCRYIASWQGSLAGALRLGVGVNVSGKLFTQENLVARFDRLFAETGARAELLRLEITESGLLVEADRSTHALSELKARGVRLSLDDFGTGLSSLTNLQRLPVDTLKIDRSFIGGVGDEGKGRDLVRSLIALTHTLGLEAVAEGVENQQQADELAYFGCEFVQGTFYSGPVEPDAAGRLLRTGQLATA